MTLIYTATGKPVKVGDKVVSRGERFIVTGWQEPHKPASTGRVNVKSNPRSRREPSFYQQFFPSVFEMDWIGRTDRAESVDPWPGSGTLEG